MRGLNRVQLEWKLVCLALNLRRMATDGDGAKHLTGGNHTHTICRGRHSLTATPENRPQALRLRVSRSIGTNTRAVNLQPPRLPGAFKQPISAEVGTNPNSYREVMLLTCHTNA